MPAGRESGTSEEAAAGVLHDPADQPATGTAGARRAGNGRHWCRCGCRQGLRSLADWPTSDQWLLWLGFILVALNLRIIFASVGPLLKLLDIDLTTTLLVTTLPPLLQGLFSVIGLKLRRRLGEERAMLVALVFLSAGCALRWLGDSALQVGTVIGSIGVVTMSVIMPVLVRKRFAPRQQCAVHRDHAGTGNHDARQIVAFRWKPRGRRLLASGRRQRPRTRGRCASALARTA